MAATQHFFLIPGFFGFTNFGEFKYWDHVERALAESLDRMGVRYLLHFVDTAPTSSLPVRAARLAERIDDACDDDARIHLIGHSTGGIDARLFLTPGANLPTRVDVARWASKVDTAVGVASPHFGAPLATLFTSMLGQRLLRVLSLAAIYSIRFGALPLGFVARLAPLLAVADDRIFVNRTLLDALYRQLLRRFSDDLHDRIAAFMAEVEEDQSLLPQLTTEGMHLFNAAVCDRPGVRYGSVVTRARPPGIRTTLRAGLDPSAHAMTAVYHGLWRLARGVPDGHAPELTDAQRRALRKAYHDMPGTNANDGIVPTISQIWGDVVRAVDADHLDIIGHFGDTKHDPPHFDWLVTGTRFRRSEFIDTWDAIATYAMRR